MENTCHLEEGIGGLIFRSGFDILVMKYASDHLISEEQHSWKHATPIWLKQFSNRFGFMMYLYSTFVMVLMLGKQSQWIQMDSKSLGGESFGMGELPFKYEDVYSVYKPQIGGPNL